ncbi:MAG TPA: 4Fe-4S dicluster domain-containing protein, partial [Firmicutes bacterium]|nr:4Fe-4S dicluster domain-containing protein [Bacillota bacterium]
ELKKGRELEGPFETEYDIDFEHYPTVTPYEKEYRSPEERIKDFNEVSKGFLQKNAEEEAKRCLHCADCSECMECVRACEPEAIFHDMKDIEEEVEVGAIVLEPGFDEFDPVILQNYGYKRFPNVVTSIEFERIMSASGPFKGHISRLSKDHSTPKKVAWIQCIGSRNTKIGRGYCSSVCCMYATKEAVIAMEHSPGLEATIFYIDIRSFGKDFDKYIDRAKNEYGVRFIQSKVGQIIEDENHDLTIKYEGDNGEAVAEIFDMVVLSVGLDAPGDAKEFQKIAGIELNEFNFAKTHEFEPFKTKVEGIFVGGAFQGPKDIPETVAQASGVAAEVDAYLTDSRFTETEKEGIFPEVPVIGDPPRIGVFVCHCGVNIGGYVDVEKVSEYAKTLPYVEYSTCNLYTCSADTQVKIKELIDEYKLNRVVVASCTPRTHEPLFQSTIREAGLNPYLFEMANIRDQNSWVHMTLHAEATDKAKELVRMAVFKAALLEPLHTQKIDITKIGLVIGGGITGMKAAMKIAEAGFEVYLVEKETELGGQARFIYESADGHDVQAYLKELEKRIETEPKIKVFKNSEIKSIDGFVGNFKSRILSDKKDLMEIEHGIIIVATGAEMYKPEEYLYGKNKNVLTQRDFEKVMYENPKSLSDFNTIAMIQCVGSRNDEHPYCSRICCTEAIKNAIHLKKLKPESEIYVFYRDIRTYGFKEKLYEEAREKGVIFIKFDDEKPPEVFDENGKLKIRVYDIVLRKTFELDIDKAILSAGIVATHNSNEELAQMLKVPLNADGFFLEAHMKLRPVDFATDGIFLAGLAHSPKMIDESVSQGYGAVARALTVLTSPYIVTSGVVSEVNEMKCDGCGLCVALCPYKAIELKEKKLFGGMKKVAEVNEALCKGCGVCAASCRSNSIDLKGFTNDEVIKEIDALVYYK